MRKNFLHPFAVAWKRKTVYNLSAVLHTTHTHAHTYDRWGPGGVFQAERSQGPPGDKVERMMRTTWRRRDLFHAETHTVHLQA